MMPTRRTVRRGESGSLVMSVSGTLSMSPSIADVFTVTLTVADLPRLTSSCPTAFPCW